MRNLKRALSMALAAIMVLGLMVVGASAASYEDFTDKDEIVNTEAVNTMVSLGVISGKEDGSYYAPADSLTRAEACTLIARMLGGGKDPVLGSNITSNITDTKGHWAETYIAYCANLGIIVGVGDGSFNPDGVLTGTAAAKMVLCALGYKPEFEGIGGANWELATNTLATKVKLYDGLYDLNPSETISRDDVAQLLYNGVQAQEVEYRNLEGDYQGTLYAVDAGNMLTNRFRVVKVTGILEANDKLSVAGSFGYRDENNNWITSGNDFGDTALEGKSLLYVTNVAGKETVNYGNLMNAQTFTVATPDDMVGQEIVLYVQFQNELSPNASQSTVIGDPIITNNNTVVETSARLKDDTAVRDTLRAGGMSNIGNPVEFRYTELAVASNANGSTNWMAATQGVTDAISTAVRGAANNTRSAGIFQRFIDNDGDGKPNFIVQIVPVLTSVNSISTDSEEYTFTGINGTISAADIVTDEDLARNDVVLINRYADDCYYVSYPETVEGTVSAFDTNNNNVTVDGTNYANSGGKMLGISGVDQFLTEEETIDNTFIFYLDPAGNVLGYKETAAVIGNYAIVKGFDRSGNPDMGYSATVKLLMQDGSTATYDLNLAASAVNLGLAASSASTQAKEDAITKVNPTYVGNPNNYDAADPTSDGWNLIGHLFSYTLDGSRVTLGYANEVNDNYIVGELANNTVVKKNTASYTLINVEDGKGAIANQNVSVNDQTVFFVKDSANDAVNSAYYVVVGLSKLPAAGVTLSINGEVMAYKAPGTSTYVAKAVFVTTNDDYKAARDYVFVTDKYVRTNTEGTPVYAFTVVYPDGTTGTMETKSSNFNELKNRVCEYDYDGKYVNFYFYNEENGNGDIDLKDVLYSKYYYVKAVQNNTVTLGNINTGATEKSLRVNSDAAIWDVQDDPVADSLSENDIVSLITDTEGAVKAAFIYDVMKGAFPYNPVDPSNTQKIQVVVNGTATDVTGLDNVVLINGLPTVDDPTTVDQIENRIRIRVPYVGDNTTISVTVNGTAVAAASNAALVAATTSTVNYSNYYYTVTDKDITTYVIDGQSVQCVVLNVVVTIEQPGKDTLTIKYTIVSPRDVQPGEGEVKMTVNATNATASIVNTADGSAITGTTAVVKQGAVLTLTATAAEGYTLAADAVKVEGAEVVANGDGTYTITVGTTDFSITVTGTKMEEGKVLVTITGLDNATATVNGTAYTEPASVAQNSDVAVVVTANEGYTIKTVQVGDGEAETVNAATWSKEVPVEMAGVTIAVVTEEETVTPPAGDYEWEPAFTLETEATDSTPANYTLNYYLAEGEGDAELKQYITDVVNASGAFTTKAATATISGGTSATVLAEDASTICTVDLTQLYKVSYMGTLVKYEVKNVAVTLPSTYVKDTKLINGKTPVASGSDVTVTASGLTNVTYTVKVNNTTPVDLDLWPAYEITGMSTTVKATAYQVPGGEKVTKDAETLIADGNYVVEGTKIWVKTTGTAAGEYFHFYLNGTPVTTTPVQTAGTSNDAVYTNPIELTTRNEDGKYSITAAEVVKLLINDQVDANLGEYVAVDSNKVYFLKNNVSYMDAKYVQATTSEVLVETPVTAAIETTGDNAGKMYLTSIDDAELVDGAIRLYTAVEVRFTCDGSTNLWDSTSAVAPVLGSVTQAALKDSDLLDTDKSEVFYGIAGTKLTLKSAAAGDGNAVDGGYILVTVNDASEAEKVNNAVAGAYNGGSGAAPATGDYTIQSTDKTLVFSFGADPAAR